MVPAILLLVVLADGGRQPPGPAQPPRAAAQQPPTPPRDARRPGAGVASIAPARAGAHEEDRRVATLTGTVTDDGGTPATGAMVFLLPADPKLGSEELFRYRAYRTSDGGQFRTGGIRPGDYLVVAVNAEQTEALMRQRPKAERLAKYADRISLTENDKLTLTLRVVSLPDVR